MPSSWELRSVKRPEGARSEIRCLRARDAGTADALLSAYGRLASASSVGRTELEIDGLDPVLLPVLAANGFAVAQRESRDLILPLGEIGELRVFRKKLPPYVVSLNRLKLLDFKKGLSNCIFSGHTGLLDDLTLLPPVWYEQSISCAIQTDQRTTGLFLIHRCASGMLMPQFLFASGLEARRDLLYLLCCAVRQAAEAYPPETRVLIRRHDEESHALASHLFPGAKGETVTAASCSEPSE